MPRLAPPVTRIDTRGPIKRVIYVQLENRSFNNLFGKFPGALGTTVGVADGAEKPLIPCPDWLPGDLAHNREAHQLCVNRGEMDGFGRGRYGSDYAYSLFDEHQIPNYWLWAREYALSDHFFASAGGPSYPNHLFFIAGTSGGVVDNPGHIEVGRLENGRPFKSWGCDAAGDEAFVWAYNEDGSRDGHDTCFSFRTVGEELASAGVDWAYYSSPPGQVGYLWNAYSAIEQVFHSDMWHENVRPVDRLIQDINADRLPSVTWVTPRWELSDHPPFSTGHAHNWITQVVNAVMLTPMWVHTTIFLTWDEWGGFYDPVVPPTVDRVGLGIRVPLLTISPYTRRGLLDDEVGEFSSPLRFISDNWGLPYLSDRIRRTHGFEHVFDFSGGPRDPVLGSRKAPAYGDPFHWPADAYTGWLPGTKPVEAPSGGGAAAWELR